MVVQPRFHPLSFRGTAVIHGAKATAVSHCESSGYRLHLHTEDPVPNGVYGDRRTDGQTDRETGRKRLKERGARGQAGRSVGRCANHGAVTVRFLVGEETIEESGREREGERETEREREREAIDDPLSPILYDIGRY